VNSQPARVSHVVFSCHITHLGDVAWKSDLRLSCPVSVGE